MALALPGSAVRRALRRLDVVPQNLGFDAGRCVCDGPVAGATEGRSLDMEGHRRAAQARGGARAPGVYMPAVARCGVIVAAMVKLDYVESAKGFTLQRHVRPIELGPFGNSFVFCIL